MFELKIDDAKYWKTCIDSIVSLIDEGTFNITKEGVSLKAMDPSGISMVSFSIPNKAFSKYEVDKASAVGLNIDNLSKILNSSRSNEQLIMKEKDGKFMIEFISKSSRRRYRLPMIETRKEAVNKEPKIEFDSEIEIKSEHLKEMLKDANLLSTYIGFRMDKDLFVVAAKGDAGELEEEHSGSSTEAIKKMDIKKPTKVTFNLDYLERMISACPQNSDVLLRLKTEEPIRADYKIGEAMLAYYLAPYMEN